MHLGSIAKMNYFVSKYLAPHSSQTLQILDVGSQDVNGSYRHLFSSPSWHYTGCDMVPGNNVDIILSNVYDWTEIASNSLDVVITGQTFEHIEYPWITLMEIRRVLKDGGLCCIIAPASGPEHKYPVDCWRIYPDGLKALAKYASLDVIEAFTEWNGSYPDGSEVWKDSVLIAQKNIKSNEIEQLLHTRWKMSQPFS